MCVYSGAQAEGSVASWGTLFMVHPRAQKGNPNYKSVFKASAYITFTSILLARQVMVKSHSHEVGKYFLPTVERHCKVTQYSRE